jgi:hypothetical protein
MRVGPQTLASLSLRNRVCQDTRDDILKQNPSPSSLHRCLRVRQSVEHEGLPKCGQPVESTDKNR